MTEPVFAPSVWQDAFRRRLDNDRELALLVRWSAFALSWESDSTRVTVAVRDGQVTVGPAGDLPTVVVRAPAGRWEKLLGVTPVPWHTDLLGMARRHEDVDLDTAGTTLVKNLRAVNRIVELARADC